MKKLPVFNLPIHPRYGVPAISWSDVVAIEADVKKWYLRQTGELPKIENEAMRFGTVVHEHIKHKKIKDIPHGAHPETKLQYQTKKYLIVGTPDDYDDETIYEYKSAKKLWGRNKTEGLGQLFAYALLTWKTDGKLRKHASLISLETKYDEDAGLYLTGEKRIITIPIRMLDILQIQARFDEAYKKADEFIKSLNQQKK